uniref:F-box domain-containing protein n=1 Tax=Leersia perrieri TaxID=77586 RepID=A0A0D9XHM8_9ORYZ
MKNLPRVTFRDLLLDPSVKPKGEFNLVSWESRLPPYTLFTLFRIILRICMKIHHCQGGSVKKFLPNLTNGLNNKNNSSQTFPHCPLLPTSQLAVAEIAGVALRLNPFRTLPVFDHMPAGRRLASSLPQPLLLITFPDELLMEILVRLGDALADLAHAAAACKTLCRIITSCSFLHRIRRPIPPPQINLRWRLASP